MKQHVLGFVFLALIFLGSSVFFGSTSYDIYRLLHAGVITKAKVLNEFVHQNEADDDVCVIYTFQPQGQTKIYQGRGYNVKDSLGKHPVGSQIDVIYDPDNPNRSRWHLDNHDKLRLIFSLVFCLFSLIIGLWFVWALAKHKPRLVWHTPKGIARELHKARKPISAKRILYTLFLSFMLGLILCSELLFKNFKTIFSSPKKPFVVLLLALGIGVVFSLILILVARLLNSGVIKCKMYANKIEIDTSELSYRKLAGFSFTDVSIGEHTYRFLLLDHREHGVRAIPLGDCVSEDEITGVFNQAGIEYAEELEKFNQSLQQGIGESVGS